MQVLGDETGNTGKKLRKSSRITTATRMANELAKPKDKETKAQVEVGACLQLLALFFHLNLILNKDSK